MKGQAEAKAVEFEDERLRERVKDWFVATGRQRLEHALQQAEKANREFNENVRVDPKTLTEPVTL